MRFHCFLCRKAVEVCECHSTVTGQMISLEWLLWGYTHSYCFPTLGSNWNTCFPLPCSSHPRQALSFPSGTVRPCLNTNLMPPVYTPWAHEAHSWAWLLHMERLLMSEERKMIPLPKQCGRGRVGCSKGPVRISTFLSPVYQNVVFYIKKYVKYVQISVIYASICMASSSILQIWLKCKQASPSTLQHSWSTCLTF